MKTTLWMLLPLFLVACGGDGAAAGDDDDDTMGDDDDDFVGDDDDDDGVPIVECTDAFDPCGGDPTGLWDVSAVCSVPLDTSALPCAVTYELTDDRSSGTIDLNASGVYDREYIVDVDFVVHVPDTCLVGPISCDNLASLSGGAFDACTDTGTGLCDCTGSLAETDAYTGTWSLDGNVIVTDDNDRTQFCVTGNQGQTMDEAGGRVHWSR